MELSETTGAPDGSAARVAELKAQIRRAWVRYALLELFAVVVPVGIVLALWALDVVPGWVLLVATALGALGIAALVRDTVFGRVRPLERELAELRSSSD